MCPHPIRRFFNWALAGVLSALLLEASAASIGAQETPRLKATPGVVHAYDTECETRVVGTIERVTRHVDGRPAGMHLLIRGSSGVVDAHVGPNMPQAIQKALHTGTPVTVVGAMETVNENRILLVRTLIVGDHTVSVRTGRGLLVQPEEASNGGSR